MAYQRQFVGDYSERADGVQMVSTHSILNQGLETGKVPNLEQRMMQKAAETVRSI